MPSSWCIILLHCFCNRYCDGQESINQFQVTLVDDILVGLLWRDYVCTQKISDTSNMKHSVTYKLELGKCIIQILSGVFQFKKDLFSAFGVAFQETILGLLQEREDTEVCTEIVKRVTEFLFLLKQHAIKKGERWPLIYLVGPALSKSYPMIRSQVSNYTLIF